MELLKKSFRVIWTTLGCLLCMVCLPLAPVATDRIGTTRAYVQALPWSERIRQERMRWSLLRILKRAALRQEKMNERGQAMFDELQRRKWDTIYAFKLHGLLLWRIFAIGYGFEALGAVLHDQYPWAFTWWQACYDGLGRSLHAFWSMFPPY